MPIRRVLVALLLAGAVTTAARAQNPGAPPAAEVGAALQRHYDGVRDFTASFTQTYEGGVLRKKAVERGTVKVKKPGRMLWNYVAPEKKTFVSNGKNIYLYVPADKQVMVSEVPGEDKATSAVLFLMGKGNLTRDFNVKYGTGGTATSHVLRLDPKIRQADYDWLEITLDRKTLQIQSLTAGDMQGGTSTFQFTDLKENVGLADNLFAFTIPRGTEVITSGQGR
jgi:outer membrane lipoprotein carrier protein